MEMKISERVLHYIWLHIREFNTLVTDCGQEVEIINQGSINRFEGPDFKNARIRFNGKSMTGDVEIHHNPGQWYSHSHHKNSDYNRVILQVTLKPGLRTIVKQNRRTCPNLSLRNNLTHNDFCELVKSYRVYMEFSRIQKFPCRDHVKKNPA